jgi:hypothetical protein
MIAAILLLLYGTLNLVAPDLTTRWQRSATDRARRRGDSIGSTIGGWFEDPRGGEEDVGRGLTARRRLYVRLIGLVEIAIALLVISGAWSFRGR